jgi:antitoxin component YwqK of YwqJK toxin-antitoxin module
MEQDTIIERDYYKNGQLKYERTYHQGKRHGVLKWWYENGQLYYELTYRQGLPHGIDKCWYNNGKPHSETPYHQGQLHGMGKWWDNNGRLKQNLYYLYGLEVTEEEYRKHELITGLSGV